MINKAVHRAQLAIWLNSWTESSVASHKFDAPINSSELLYSHQTKCNHLLSLGSIWWMHFALTTHIKLAFIEYLLYEWIEGEKWQHRLAVDFGLRWWKLQTIICVHTIGVSRFDLRESLHRMPEQLKNQRTLDLDGIRLRMRYVHMRKSEPASLPSPPSSSSS